MDSIHYILLSDHHDIDSLNTSDVLIAIPSLSINMSSISNQQRVTEITEQIRTDELLAQQLSTQ